LEISSAGALPAGTSLTIGAGDAGLGATAGLPSSAFALSTGKASGTLNVPGTAGPVSSATAGSSSSAPPAVSPASGGSGVAAVPEPGTLGLLAAGVGTALLAAWRKRRHFLFSL
jgi:hypothetical protein